MERKPKILVEAVQEYSNNDKALDEVAESRWNDEIVSAPRSRFSHLPEDSPHLEVFQVP